MYTRLHLSRIHTGGCTWSQGVYLVPGGTWSWGLCTWSGGCVPGPRGVLGPGGVPGPRGCTWYRGVYLVPGRGWCQVLPSVNRMTNRCKNITLPQNFPRLFFHRHKHIISFDVDVDV